MRILVIADEQELVESLLGGLAAEGFLVCHEPTLPQGLVRASAEAFAVVILDIAAPRRRARQLLGGLRQRGVMSRVLVVSAESDVADRVAALDSGADDYLLKPFALAELMARLRALLRRDAAGEFVLKSADLTINLLTRTACRLEQALDLTDREFSILAYLVRHAGRVVSREALGRDVWQEPLRGTPLDNIIDVHMLRLRKKLGERDSRLILTVRNVGFMWCEPGM